MDEISDIVFDALRSFFYMLTTSIYQLIKWLYDIFLRLCNSRVLDDTGLEIITDKVGIILGLVMLFIVTFSVIQMVLEPDKLTDKEKGIANIVKKIILVVVMLGISQFAFRLLYALQVEVVESDIIRKFLIPYDMDEEAKENFGGIISADLFLAFYKIDERLIENVDINDADYLVINAYNNLYKLRDSIIDNNDFEIGAYYLNREPISDNDYIMEFNYIISTAVGTIVVYFIFSYCISVGMRTFQLAFLEIISPMAIVSYLSPKKDTMFEKWWKKYLATYIDVFIRIIIINLVVFLILVLLGANSSQVFWDSVGGKTGEFWTDTLIKVFIIIALLMFAKKVPDLLKDFFPEGESKLGFGLTSPKKMFDNMLFGNVVSWGPKAATGVVGGALGGATMGLLGGGFRGFAGGLLKGGLSGLKGQGFLKSTKGAWQEQKATNKRISDWRNAGGTNTFGRWGAAFNQWRGVDTLGDIDTRDITKLDDYAKIQDQIEAIADNVSVVKDLKKQYEAIKDGGRISINGRTETDAEYWARVKKAEKTYKTARNHFITTSMQGKMVGDANADLIRNYQEQLNRMVSSDSGLFEGFAPIDSYKAMDSNTILAKNKSSTRKTTKKYAENQANAKYSGSGKH